MTIRRTYKRIIAGALAVLIVGGSLPAEVGVFRTWDTGIVADAYDNNPYTDLIPTSTDDTEKITNKQVTFAGKKWHIIKDESTSATAGTVTLLSANNFDNTKFDVNGSNVYANSSIKTALDNLTTNGSFKKFADVIKDTDNGKIYLLSDTEAAEVPQNLRKAFSGAAWWLRTQGTNAGSVKYVYVNDDKQNNHGRIVDTGVSASTGGVGVRPALQLDLSKVVFDATSKTFNLPATAPTVNPVTGTKLVKGYTTGSVSVSATAPDGHTLSYQWYSNTTNSNEDGTKIDGATSAKYNIETGKDSGTYYYYCVVTATRTDNSQTASVSSNAATVTVADDTDELIEMLAQEKSIDLNDYYLIPAADMYYTTGENWSKGDISGRHTNLENEHSVATKQFTIQELPEDSVIFCKPYYSINVAATADSPAISATIGKANYLLTKVKDQSEFSQWADYKYFGINLTKYVEGSFDTKTEMTPEDLEHMSDIFRIYVPKSETVAKIGDNSYSTLADAVRAAQAGDTIVLQRDATDNLVLTEGKEITFDLNGHTLTNVGKHNTIITQIGSKLTLTDSSEGKTGKVDNTENQRAPIFNNGGTVILNGGTITRSEEAGYEGGNTYYTVVNHGTMTINEGVKVENDTANYSSLIANGYNTIYSPNKQQIDPDIISGYKEGVNAEHPTLTINGGTFKGGNQALKNDVNGVANISGGSFSSSTGNAVYNVGELTISGGEFTANTEGKFALRNAFESGKTYGPESAAGSATVTGGTFTGAVAKDEGTTVSVTGGTFSFDPTDLLSEGYYVTDNGNDTYTVTDIPPKTDVTGVVLDKNQIALKYGESMKLTATVSPDDADEKTVTWSSNNMSVATVDENGVVKAVKPGTATITVTADNGTDTEDDDKTAICTVTVNKADSVVITAPKANTLTANGKEQELVTEGKAEGGTMVYALGDNDKTAPDGRDAIETSPTATDAGTYYVWYKVLGDENHNDTEPVCVTVKINRLSIKDAKVMVRNKTYTGKALKPGSKVVYNGKRLKKGRDYTVTYKNNKKVGVATAVIKGIGNYKGTVKTTFNVKPKKVSVKSISSPKAKQLKVTWKKTPQATGYQIKVSTNKNKFKGKALVKNVFAKKNSFVSKTFSGMKSGKTYYVKIRAYKQTKSGKIYGQYSAVKKIKVK